MIHEMPAEWMDASVPYLLRLLYGIQMPHGISSVCVCVCALCTERAFHDYVNARAWVCEHECNDMVVWAACW